jgi:hypothetical protein
MEGFELCKNCSWTARETGRLPLVDSGMKRSDRGGGLQGCRARILSINHLSLCVIEHTIVLYTESKSMRRDCIFVLARRSLRSERATDSRPVCQQDLGEWCGEGMGFQWSTVGDSNHQMRVLLRQMIVSNSYQNACISRALWKLGLEDACQEESVTRPRPRTAHRSH